MIAPRLDIDALAPVPHGGPAGAADDLGVPLVLDFSANINAWGPAPTVIAATRGADPAAYPDPDALAPRRAAARLWALPLERTRFAPGAVELIHRSARAYLRPADRALIAAPAFGEYARAVSAAGALAVEVRAEHADTDPSTDVLAAKVRALRPRLVFVASPSSPLGATRADDELERLADAVAPHGVLVLDEAYRSFALGRLAPPALPDRDDVIHLRSITKDCALAGVRAAFAITAPAVLRALDAAGLPWSASTPAQAAAAAALAPDGAAHVEHTLGLIAAARRELAAGLSALGLDTLPSAGNFLCARIRNDSRLTTHRAGAVSSAAVPVGARECGIRTRECGIRTRECGIRTRDRTTLGGVGRAGCLTVALRVRGIRVRDCTSFGLPDHIRVAVRTPPENRRLLACLEEILC